LPIGRSVRWVLIYPIFPQNPLSGPQTGEQLEEYVAPIRSLPPGVFYSTAAPSDAGTKIMAEGATWLT